VSTPENVTHTLFTTPVSATAATQPCGTRDATPGVTSATTASAPDRAKSATVSGTDSMLWGHTGILPVMLMAEAARSAGAARQEHDFDVAHARIQRSSGVLPDG
jgi:hypothetical protein